METLLTIIVWSLISLLVIMINTFVTKELTEIFKGTRLDKPMVYRICLIPPIGFIVFWLATLLIVFAFFLNIIIDIWKQQFLNHNFKTKFHQAHIINKKTMKANLFITVGCFISIFFLAFFQNEEWFNYVIIFPFAYIIYTFIIGTISWANRTIERNKEEKNK